jgi:cytochrome b
MPSHTIRIWDLPTRLFHWLLAASEGKAYIRWHLRD